MEQARCSYNLTGFKKCLSVNPLQHFVSSVGELGLGGRLTAIVNDIYQDSTTRLKVGEDSTTRLKVGESLSNSNACTRGVKQACPLVFNSIQPANEQLLRSLEDIGTNYQFQEICYLCQ